MSWLFLAGLGIIWAVCVLPWGHRGSLATVEEFDRGLELLADTGRTDGRWIVCPRKGAPFIGARNRARARARERRRRVFFFFLEAIGLTFLIGLFPPLRPMWFATATFIGLLVVYVWLLLAIRRSERELRRMREQLATEIESPDRPTARPNGNGGGVVEPHVAKSGGSSKPTYNGLVIEGEEEVHVVIRSGRELQSASAR